MSTKTLPFLLLSTAWLLLIPAGARAQTKTARDIPTLALRPSLDYEGILTVDSAETLGHLRWSVGALFGYAHDPLVARQGDQELYRYVGNQVPIDLWMTLGLWRYLEIGLHLPIVAYQDSDAGGAGGAASLSSATLGDLRLLLKGRFFPGRLHGFGLALTAAITAPTGGALGANGGEAMPTFEPRLVADYRFAQGTLVALNVGVRIRDPFSVANLRVGNELVYGLGLEVPVWWLRSGHPAAGRLSVLAELFGSVGFADAADDPDAGLDAEEVPLEALAAVRYRFRAGWRLTAGGGAGLTHGYGTPDFRLFLGVSYTPRTQAPPPRPRARPTDRDGDGILDQDDRCPTVPEDRDGFEDKDGCPDPDNDHDGVCDPNPAIQQHLARYARTCKGSDGAPNAPEDRDGFQDGDGVPDPDNDHDGLCDSNPVIQGRLAAYARQCKGRDQCPNQAEVVNGVKDDDGCPDKGRPKVHITRAKIDILDKVYFRTSSARILRKSHSLLRQVATVLRQNPWVLKVRIEGHTDARGGAASNQRLSARRAESVRRFLVRQGVAPGRLEAVGYGESRPRRRGCSRLRSRSARKTCHGENRRVQFTILKVDKARQGRTHITARP